MDTSGRHMSADEAIQALEILQEQHNLLKQIVYSLIVLVASSILVTNKELSLIAKKAYNALWERIFKTNAGQIERRNEVQNRHAALNQVDKVPERSKKVKLNAISSAFKFELQTDSSLKRDSADALRQSEVLIEQKVEECALLEVKGRVKKRNDLANAIQKVFAKITDSVPWTKSSLPDHLIQTKSISEIERQHIDSINTGEQNKIRTLLLIVLKKDYRSLFAFLTCVGNFNPQIQQAVDELIPVVDDMNADTCNRCLLKDRVNINYVADKLFGEGFITKKVMSKITKLDVYTDVLDEIWEDLLDELFVGDNINDRFELMIKAVERSGFHADISQLLYDDLHAGVPFVQCKCGPQMLLLKVGETDGGDSGVSHECFVTSECNEESIQRFV